MNIDLKFDEVDGIYSTEVQNLPSAAVSIASTTPQLCYF